jgi:hypothetical protein
VAGDLTTPTEVATVVEERGSRGFSEGLMVEEIEGEFSLAVLGSASAEDPLAVLVSSPAGDPDMNALTSPAAAEDPGSASSFYLIF